MTAWLVAGPWTWPQPWSFLSAFVTGILLYVAIYIATAAAINRRRRP